MASRRLAVLVLAAAVHAACWTPPTAVRGGRIAAQRKTVLLVDQAAPFRVTMRPDAAGALGVEVDANESGAAVITSIVRGSHVSELLEVGDAPQPGCTRAPPAQATAEHRPASAGKGPANLPHGTGLRRLALSGPRPKSPEGRHGPCVRRWGRGCHLPPHCAAPRTARCTAPGVHVATVPRCDTPAIYPPYSATYHPRWWSRSMGSTRRQWVRWWTSSLHRRASYCYIHS